MFYGWVDIICFNNKHGIELEDNFNNLPTIHWLPKVHKRPYKFRYIVNSRFCSTKELSVRMTFVLQAIKTHVKKSTVIKFMRTLGLTYFGL